MSTTSRSAACDQCRTPLPAEAKFCPGCGRAADSGTSGMRRLETTIHEGDRLALGKTLLGGLAMYEALLGVRAPSRRGRSKTPRVIDMPLEPGERSTAPDGVDTDPPLRAQAVADPPPMDAAMRAAGAPVASPEPPAATAPQAPPAQAQGGAGDRVSHGTLWRWQRLHELVEEQAAQPPPPSRDSSPHSRETLHLPPRTLRIPAVRVALLAALVIVGGSLLLVLMR